MNVIDAFLQMSQTPYEAITQDVQESINQDWDTVPNVFRIKEEKAVGSGIYRDVEVQINHVIDTATGQYKNGDDWRQIIFKEINHSIERGRMYVFNDNYWIATFTDEFNQVTKDVTVRRCNNVLKWEDKLYPCVIDYEASSSQPIINESVITPNSTIKVIVQGNKDTLSLDINQKFLLGNDVKKRPYKIINYIDYLQNGIMDMSVPLVYLDLQLVQESSNDFVEDDKPSIESCIKIEPEITEILQGRTITLNGAVWIGGRQVEQSIMCEATNAPVGNYELIQGENVFTLTNKLQSNQPLVLTFTSGGLTKTMEIKLRARF